MKVISINIYKFPLGDCTNGGASSQFDELFLFSEDSTIGEVANYADMKGIDYRQCFKVNTMHNYGNYKRAQPVFKQLYKGAGPMAGGNHGYTSDSRYEEVTGGLKYPISIHDRFEVDYHNY